MTTENPDPPADPPADPPTDPPANPPSQSYDDSEVRGLITDLSSRVDELTAEVKSLTPINGPSDQTPVRRPWTARGRR